MFDFPQLSKIEFIRKKNTTAVSNNIEPPPHDDWSSFVLLPNNRIDIIKLKEFGDMFGITLDDSAVIQRKLGQDWFVSAIDGVKCFFSAEESKETNYSNYYFSNDLNFVLAKVDGKNIYDFYLYHNKVDKSSGSYISIYIFPNTRM